MLWNPFSRRVQCLLGAITLRRMKNQMKNGKPIVELPKKDIFIEHVRLSEEERRLYDTMQNEGRLLVSKLVQPILIIVLKSQSFSMVNIWDSCSNIDCRLRLLECIFLLFCCLHKYHLLNWCAECESCKQIEVVNDPAILTSALHKSICMTFFFFFWGTVCDVAKQTDICAFLLVSKWLISNLDFRQSSSTLLARGCHQLIHGILCLFRKTYV